MMNDDPRKSDTDGAAPDGTAAGNSNGGSTDAANGPQPGKPYVDPSILAEAANDSAPSSDADDAEGGGPSLTEEQKRIVELEEEIAELKDRSLRAMADADNAQKRAAREVADSRKYGATGLARDVLTVADNLGRAMQAVPEVSQEEDENLFNLRTGVDLTLKELIQALERHGVQKVTPEPGERFDHNRHQAMFEVPTDEMAPGCVAQIVQDGYVMHDRLLRPALVGVAKKPPKESESGAAPETGAESGDTGNDDAGSTGTPDSDAA